MNPASTRAAHTLVCDPVPDEAAELLSEEALAFLAALHRRFERRRRELLEMRRQRQHSIDEGALPDFLPETRAIREGDWHIAPVPADLQDRRVEITGPVDRKMVINALNSGARVFMADFEDSNAPTWSNNVLGQRNLHDAVRRTIAFTSPAGKQYELASQTATLMVRPRGWHLVERHLQIDGEPISASLFDFGLYLFHNASELMRRGSGPYFYLPKLESHLEARLWNDVFVFAQEHRRIPQGTIKATVLIETILAAFELHEILYELREHSAGLNCGRWDYIFSYIKKLRNHPQFLVPDRAQVTMATPFLRDYTRLVIRTCHQRGAHAMGGMAAQIPIKGDEQANREALAKVRADKEREVRDGHDGTWVAHPGLVPIAQEIFDAGMPGPHQLARPLEDLEITAADLLRVPEGTITAAGLRTNVEVGLRYLEAWLRGSGCVPLHHLMEDAATAEICRTQIWQWIHHPEARLADGTVIDAALFRIMLTEELAALRAGQGPAGWEQSEFPVAARLYEQLILNPELVDFLTLPAYAHLA